MLTLISVFNTQARATNQRVKGKKHQLKTVYNYTNLCRLVEESHIVQSASGVSVFLYSVSNLFNQANWPLSLRHLYNLECHISF